MIVNTGAREPGRALYDRLVSEGLVAGKSTWRDTANLAPVVQPASAGPADAGKETRA
jgi:hypothetical protein